MYTPNRSIEQRPMPMRLSPKLATQPLQSPIYHVYSHYGCSSKDIDGCETCKYLLQSNTYLHSTPQSLLAVSQRPVLPLIQGQVSPTSIEPDRYRIDDSNDLYILPEIFGSPKNRREAEDAAIIKICLKDKSIDRIILVDADEDCNSEEDNEILYVRLHDLEKQSS